MAWIRMTSGDKFRQCSGVFYNVNQNSYLEYDGQQYLFQYVTPGQTIGGFIEIPNIIRAVYHGSNQWYITPSVNCTITTSYGNSYTLTGGVQSTITLGSNPNTPESVTITAV